MNNLITIFMNHKIKSLVEYVVFLYGRYNDFTREVAESYIKTYIDNYYYGIFHTIDDNKYSLSNLELEFDGVMEEMLYNYGQHELEVSNDEYTTNCGVIKDLNKICYELIKIDTFTFNDKDDIEEKVTHFITKKKVLNDLIDNRINKLVTMVKSYYNMSNRLLNYNDNYYLLDSKCFINDSKIRFMELKNNIKVLENYKPNMVSKIYKDSRLDYMKLECLINKVSLLVLKNFVNHEKMDQVFIEIPSSVVSRGKLDDKIYDLIDNPLFQKYVVLCIEYNTYLNQKSAFNIDFKLACIQDFLHINDVYQKTDNIFKEGMFNYLIVSDCREKDRDFFEHYENDAMQVLIFKEEE